MVDSVSNGEYKNQIGENMEKRIELSDQVREGLIKNIYGYDVTTTFILLLNLEKKTYLELMASKSLLKIFSECKLPVFEPLLTRSKNTRRAIIECGGKGNLDVSKD